MPDFNKPPTRKECMDEQCSACLGHWADGRTDCENVRCSQYYYMPYRKLEPDYEWRKYNPKRVGRVTWEESKREISEEERERLRDMAKKRFGKKKDK